MCAACPGGALCNTHFTELTLSRCHSCNDPRSLLLWCIFGKELSATAGQLVLGLHGNNFLLGILR